MIRASLNTENRIELRLVEAHDEVLAVDRRHRHDEIARNGLALFARRLVLFDVVLLVGDVLRLQILFDLVAPRALRDGIDLYPDVFPPVMYFSARSAAVVPSDAAVVS